MGMTEWNDVYSLLDTAKKLVVQSHNILARDDFAQSWLEELKDVDDLLAEYLTHFYAAWLSDNDLRPETWEEF